MLIMKKNTTEGVATDVIVVVIVLAVLFIVSFQVPEYYKTFSNDQNFIINQLPDRFGYDWIQNMANMILCYTCQSPLFIMRSNLKHGEQERRVKKVIKFANLYTWIYYSIICLLAYFSLGENQITSIFLLRKSPRNLRINKVKERTDILKSISIIIYFLVLIIQIPQYIDLVQRQICGMHQIKKKTLVFTVKTLVVLLAFLIPCLFTDLVDYLGISSIIVLIIPFVIRLACLKREPGLRWTKIWYCMLVSMLGVASVVCIVGKIYEKLQL